MSAVFAGYTTGGTETGPISLGWKGGVGNHVVYTLLMIGAGSMAVMGIVSQAFRDSDLEAASELLGIEDLPQAQNEVGNSWWPVFAALGLKCIFSYLGDCFLRDCLHYVVKTFFDQQYRYWRCCWCSACFDWLDRCDRNFRVGSDCIV